MDKYAKLIKEANIKVNRRIVKQIGAAVVGVGWCGGIRAETLAAHPLVKELHLAEVREDRLEEMEAKTRPTSATTDYRKLLDRKGIDAVYISATPENLHFPMASECLQAGKHVFLEKPIAVELHEADELIAIAEGQEAQVHHRLLAALQPEVRLRAPLHPRRHHRQAGQRAGQPPHHARPGQEDQRPHQALAGGDGVRRTTSTSCSGAWSRRSRCASTRRSTTARCARRAAQHVPDTQWITVTMDSGLSFVVRRRLEPAAGLPELLHDLDRDGRHRGRGHGRRHAPRRRAEHDEERHAAADVDHARRGRRAHLCRRRWRPRRCTSSRRWPRQAGAGDPGARAHGDGGLHRRRPLGGAQRAGRAAPEIGQVA